jgi:hypothetical protein
MEKKSRSVALLSAGLLVGGAAAGALVVSAAHAAAEPSLTAASSGSSSTEGPSAEGRRFAPDQGSTPVRGDEKAVSADVAAKLKAAALKSVPGGTVFRVETDAGDAAYEAHVKKSDGSFVTVKFDKSYAVTAVEDGMGKGDPQSGGRHGGHRSSDGSGESGPSSGA